MTLSLLDTRDFLREVEVIVHTGAEAVELQDLFFSAQARQDEFLAGIDLSEFQLEPMS